MITARSAGLGFLLPDAYAALTEGQLDEIENHPANFVAELYHAIPEIASRSQALNAVEAIDQMAADAFATTTDYLAILDEVATPTSWKHLAAIAVNPRTPGPVLGDIVLLAHGATDYGAWEARFRALRHPNLPDFLMNWATCADVDAAEGVAYHPNLTIDQQRRLSRHPALRVKGALAHNSHIDPIIWQSVREQVQSIVPGSLV